MTTPAGNRARKASRVGGAITVIGGMLVVGDGGPVGAATLTVDTASDDPADGLTLREAIDTAADGDTIVFDPSLAGATIEFDGLTNGQLRIVTDLTITGLGRDALTLTSNDGDVLYIYNHSVTVTDLSIEAAPDDGIEVSDNGGGPTLTLTRVDISGSSSDGVNFESVTGSVSISDSTLTENGSRGVAMNQVHDLTVMDSTLTGNDSSAIYADDVYGDVMISGSTFDDNGRAGVGLEEVRGNLSVTNSTFTGNDNDAIYVDDFVEGDVTLTDLELVDNGDAWSLQDVAGAAVTITDVTASATGVDTDNDMQLYADTGVATSPTLTVSNVTGAGDDTSFRLYGFGDTTISNVELTGTNGAYLRARRMHGDVSITDSRVVGERYASLYLYRAYDADISIDEVEVNGEVGMRRIYDGAINISNATVGSERDGGIEIRYASDVSISDVSVSSPDDTGIELNYIESSVGASLPGDITIERATVSGAGDEGIRVRRAEDGVVTITDTEIADAGEVGLYLRYVGDMTLNRVTITGSEEEAVSADRGLGTLSIASSTLIDNGGAGDHALNLYDGTVDIAHSTIAGNGAGASSGGIEVYAADVTIDHTILTENGGTAVFVDGPGSVTATNSLVPVGSGLGASNVESDTADLSPVGDFGGETRVAPPLSGSAAVDAGDPAIAGEPATDQRGGPRKIGTIDIGAVEVDPVSSVAVADATVDENAGVVSVEVERTGSVDLPISVDLATVDGSATAGDDYTATTGTVSWAAGETGVKTVDVPITDDTIAEPSETFAVNLSNPVDTTISDAEATVTILDVPPPLAALSPARLADTRAGKSTVDDDFNGDGKLGAGDEYKVQIAGRGGVPADAKAATINVTAIGADSNGFVTVHPCLPTPPNASSLNYTAGVNLGNEVTVPLDANGAACFYTSSSVHLTVDVVAFMPGEGRGMPLTPARLLDTRIGATTVDGRAAGRGRVPAGAFEQLSVAGRGGVPADAAAVIVNVTSIGASGNGYVTAHPCLPTAPNASSLNVVAGVNRGNELIAQVDANGDICLFVSTEMNLTVDVTGYIPNGTALNSVSPARILDTRANGETVDDMSEKEGKRSAGSEYTLQVGGRGGVPGDAKAAILNVTAINPESVGFLTVHPCVSPRPEVAALNYVPGVNGGNEIVASLDASGQACIYTSAAADITVDVVGYLA
ncbi:right-handed parallel beta-helix repeat-containing protein [Ilumatobacter coccineus]|nr:right-handed parallel beta-helix repeat-containing protein [Ilumatobacter coccineus]